MSNAETLKRSRLELVEVSGPEQKSSFARDVREGLTARPRKQLSCKYFYDQDGSQIFEEICAIPEYYLTRAESEILQKNAHQIAARLPAGISLVELGSGSSVKTRILIEAILDLHPRLLYIPIDVSRSMLEETARGLITEIAKLDVLAIAAEYEAGLAKLAQIKTGPKLFLWLGSNIGNFDRAGAAAFLRRVKTAMAPGDRVLVGVDLRKDRAVLEPAYDDAQGVTARFNKNILARINRELDADFDLEGFDHRAIYDEPAGCIEMYLVSNRAQTVHVRAIDLEVSFERGEMIHTEDSYKYSAEEIEALANAAGMSIEERWLDAGRRFCETMLRV